jgi:stage V sporulation protein AB
MLAKNICLALLGFSAGITAAGGLFSFIIGLGVISDFADRTHTGEQVMLYEDAVAAGGSLGAVISVYHPAVPFDDLLHGVPCRNGRLDAENSCRKPIAPFYSM